jgi:hypothetical protein
MSISNSLTNKIKTDLRKNDLHSIRNLLKLTQDLEVFQDIREQKILTISNSFKELSIDYLASVIRLLKNKEEIKYEQNYIYFLDKYLNTNQSLKQEIKELLIPFLNRELKEFLWLAGIQLNTFTERMVNQFYKDYEKTQNNLGKDIETLAEFSERSHHFLKGRLNDNLFAFTCLINLFSEWQMKDVKSDFIGIDEDGAKSLTQAFILASQINSFQFAFDKLSYGDWKVEKVIKYKHRTTFQFKITDSRLEIARDLGLRRVLAQTIIGREDKRWLRQSLEQFTLSALDYALDYYQNQDNTLKISKKEYDEGKLQAFRDLDQLNAEDELMIGLNMKSSEILSPYFTICALLGFVIAAYLIKKKSKSYLYQYMFPELPEQKIKDFMDKFTIVGGIDLVYTDQFITKLPINQHLDLFKTPFLRNKNGKVFALDHLSESNWPGWVRSYLMRGGEVANKLGKSWEGYIAWIMQEYQWKEIVQGVKIRNNENTLTDVDIVAKKQNLLLLIQLKIHYGNSVNVYDQWKCRKKLINGVMQAKTASKEVQNNINILSPYFSSNSLAEINLIQPLVLTNVHLFNGWKYDDIPIMSVGSLMQILTGANVRFVTKNNSEIYKKSYFKSKIVSVDEFLQFLNAPLDWRIGNPTYELHYHKEVINDSILEFPLLENDEEEIYVKKRMK